MGISVTYPGNNRLLKDLEGESFTLLPPDLRIPHLAIIEVHDEPDLDVDVDLRVVFDDRAGRYVAESVMVFRREAGSGVDTAALRTIPIQKYLQRLSAIALIEDGHPFPEPFPAELAERIRAAGPSNNDSLRWLARIYQLAYALNQPPNQAVQEALRMPTPTASAWIRRARDRGILQEPKPPTEGEEIRWEA